jgi:hypothetical protein
MSKNPSFKIQLSIMRIQCAEGLSSHIIIVVDNEGQYWKNTRVYRLHYSNLCLLYLIRSLPRKDVTVHTFSLKHKYTSETNPEG